MGATGAGETIDRVGQSVNSRIPQRARDRQEFFIGEFSGGESGIVTAASELASFIPVQAEPFAADAVAEGSTQGVRIGVNCAKSRNLIEDPSGGKSFRVPGEALANHDRRGVMNEGLGPRQRSPGPSLRGSLNITQFVAESTDHESGSYPSQSRSPHRPQIAIPMGLNGNRGNLTERTKVKLDCELRCAIKAKNCRNKHGDQWREKI